MGKLRKRNQRNQYASHGPVCARAGSSRRSHAPTRPKRAGPARSNDICFPPTCATRRPSRYTAAPSCGLRLLLFIFSLAFHFIQVFGSKVKEWRQLCVHFSARVQPILMQSLDVGEAASPPQASWRWKHDAGFGMESRRAWMERHDPAGCRIVRERAGNGIISRADEGGSVVVADALTADGFSLEPALCLRLRC
jgi:hypothetical protein